MMKRVLASLILAYIAAACASSTESSAGAAQGPSSPEETSTAPAPDTTNPLGTWDAGEVGSDGDGALALGPLIIREHCVYVDDDETGRELLLVLPAGRSFLGEEGRSIIVDGDEFAEGSAVFLGGSPAPRPAHAKGCDGAGQRFFVSSIGFEGA